MKMKTKVERKSCTECNLTVRCIPPTGFKCPHGKKKIDKWVVRP
jgi:hypothetical protein